MLAKMVARREELRAADPELSGLSAARASGKGENAEDVVLEPAFL